MKTLLLMRHAKAAAAISSLADFDRPLTDEGRRAAELIGELILRRKVMTDLALSSPALRARETIDIVMKAARLHPELRYDQRIYEAGPLGLLEVIHEIEEDRNRVLLVGHNPGIEELLEMLIGRVEHLATGTLAKIDFEANKWSEAGGRKGNLDWLVQPKELPTIDDAGG
ncbi:MAG: SixA phosphatase family protein [Pyrinomonadaceae bacterium]